MKYEGTVKVKFEDGTKHDLPLYTTNNFLDTEEGWALLREGVETGDMRRYRATRYKHNCMIERRKGGYWPVGESV